MRVFLLIVPLLVLCACLSPKYGELIRFQENAVDLNNTEKVRALLMAQHEEWKGVPYQYGGLSQNGVDCSGLVYLTFLTRFGIELPRTTVLLARVGTPVPRRFLKAGDLMFFKTGFGVRHVGVCVGGDRFLHASKNHGVMISGLENSYWRAHYWKARRVEN